MFLANQFLRYASSLTKFIEDRLIVLLEKNNYVHPFLDTFFCLCLISPIRGVYVVSDTQLEEFKRNQRQEELDNIEDYRKRLEESYQVRIKVLDERQNEIKEELKACSHTKVKAALNKK